MNWIINKAVSAGIVTFLRVNHVKENLMHQRKTTDASLYAHYTRMQAVGGDFARPAHGTASRETREALLAIMPANVWCAIEMAAKLPIDSPEAEVWRERARYILDAPDVLL